LHASVVRHPEDDGTMGQPVYVTRPLDFKMSTDCEIIVDLWTNWGKPAPTDPTACCSVMEGVTCDTVGKVTVINWSYQSLSGSIPPEIGNLTSLLGL